VIQPDTKKRLKTLLRSHEGYRQFVYKDTVGKNTVGIGRNLDDRGITEQEAMDLLENDISYFDDRLASELSFYNNLDEVRKAVLIDMAFNLGLHGLLAFKKTLHLISMGSYAMAASEMMNSKWAGQVKGRAVELSEAMRSGAFE
jgi:lysozyme